MDWWCGDSLRDQGAVCFWWGERYTKGWGVERHDKGKPGKSPDLQERQGAIVGKGREGGAGHCRKLLRPQCAHLSSESQRAKCSRCNSPPPTLSGQETPARPHHVLPTHMEPALQASTLQQYKTHSKRNTERACLNFKKKEELGWRKQQLESSHLNKPAY